MSLNVSVLFPSGHRRNTRVSSNTVISQTLEEVCMKENLDVEKYSFLFQRKILDESLSWRYANVPNNAKLELVKQEKSKQEVPVRIALQYEGGPRLQGSFLSSTTLMEILQHWKIELSTLTPPEGQELSILYLRQEISGNVKMTHTTLKSMGIISGSAILRLLFKPVTHEEVFKKVVDKKSAPTQGNQRTQQTAEVPVPQQAHKVSLPGKRPGKITPEMLQDALYQVSGPDRTLNFIEEEEVTIHDPRFDQAEVETASSNVKSMDVSDENSAGGSRNGRVRQRRPNSGEAMPIKKIKQTPTTIQKQPDFSDFKFPEETAGMDVYSAEEEDDINIQSLAQPCDRETIFFDEKEVENSEIQSEDPGDEFFELTTDDIRKMITELRSLQTESDNKPLLTSRSRELQRSRTINQYPKILIRIVFPNRKILQGIFRPAETVETLYNFVKMFLSTPNIDFYLYTAPPKVILKDKQSILHDNHLAPASKVYFGLEHGDFDEKMLSQKCETHKGSTVDAALKVRSIFELKSPAQMKEEPHYSSTPSSGQTALPEDGAPSTSQKQTTTNQTAHPSGARPKVPKWFKLGK